MIWCVWIGFLTMAASIWIINETSNTNTVNLGLAGFAIGFLILVFGTFGTALAQEHHHPPQDEAIHQQFYKNWMMPDNRTVSCCHDEDCSPAESKFENGHWMARKVDEDGEFTEIPDRKIERDRDSPDGRSHLCGRRYEWTEGKLSVFCFLPAAGG